MPICPNCGKEVSGFPAACPDCGYRFKNGFKAEGTQRHIDELLADITRNKQTGSGAVQKKLGNLSIDRPIVFIDIETTGLDKSRDRIIEFSAIKIYADGNEKRLHLLINPEIPIPKEAMEIHGITDKDVVDSPAFHQYAADIRNFLDGSDLAGFNIIAFDLPFLETEFRRAKMEFSYKGRNLIDSQIIFHLLEPRNLEAAYRKYCGKELVNPHRAGTDVLATVEVLEGQLSKHPELPRDASKLGAYCNPERANYIDAEGKFIWSNGEAICSFGKFKGISLKHIAETEPRYLEWLSRADFSPEVQDLAKRAMQGEFPEPS
jgi:DNA polymerase III subunit epsilon